MRKTIFFCVLAVFFASQAFAGGRLHTERWYQDRWCAEANGTTEVVMPDRSRCDCLTDTHAIEFDFADKWAEAIGQALLYGAHTGEKPGIVLIMEKETDTRYLKRLKRVINDYGLPIRVWTIKPQ